MKILEFTSQGDNSAILSPERFLNSELSVVCNKTEKGAYAISLDSQIFKCMNAAGYRLAHLEVWPTKVVLLHTGTPYSTATVLKKFKRNQCIKELSSIIDQLSMEGYQCVCLTFLIDPKYHLFQTPELNKYEYRLMCALDEKAKDLLMPILYFADKINLFIYDEAIDVYGAARIDKKGLSYLCAYDTENVDSICRCSHHIISDFYETFQKAPDCLLLMDIYIGGLSMNEIVHRHYGLPLIDNNLNLHGINHNNVNWVYGYKSNIIRLEKYLSLNT